MLGSSGPSHNGEKFISLTDQRPFRLDESRTAIETGCRSLEPMLEGTTRSKRDWIVDWISFTAAVALGLATSFDSMPAEPAAWHVFGVVALGLASCLGLWFRRRWPLALALLTAAASAVSPAAGGAAIVALFSLAVHRPWQQALAGAIVMVLSSIIFLLIYPPGESIWVNSLLVVIFFIALVGWGRYVRARRELLFSLRERARVAESDRDSRLAQAREQERTRIAREMHDVLAHRISLVAMSAGALEYRPDASPEEVAKAASVVRENAHLALEELREVVVVLREPTEGQDAMSEPPQPTLQDLGSLVADSRNSGTVVELTVDVEQLEELPDSIGRTAYRVIQEGLTNVRKHARQSPAETSLMGGPGGGLTITVSNDLPAAEGSPGEPIPGTGTGLTGLAERVGLSGGRLDYGPRADGSFRLDVWLPWDVTSPPAEALHAGRDRNDG